MFTMGDIACAEGALSAGCRYFGGYPITPATEIAEWMARRMPELGGAYVQYEDEIASITSVIGASWTGTKAMTATSGPGVSLMLEAIGLAIMTETPLVLVNIMRGGPSTGQPTRGQQGDIMQAKWGSHGDYEIIALTPASVQEMFDQTVQAFNLAEEFRTPVFILADETVGHMREKLVIPDEKDIKIVTRKQPTVDPSEYLPFKADDNLVPPMALLGSKYQFYATGLTHDERGYPSDKEKIQIELITRLNDKILKNSDKIVDVEKFQLDDAKIGVIAYGTPSRSAKRAIKDARKEGIKVGLLRLKTVWPFPEKEVVELASSVNHIIVAEQNLGQVYHMVRAAAAPTPVHLMSKPAGMPQLPNEILEKVRQVNSI
ncbi:MAG: 2-oxoacid:acceptor oxidoreductase subunit alpha [Candidatus Thorarchaeota archaeon]|nr:MAG: 2-oxoacid:acceptor oxidoreductase subunit alpha [Candidatus Thorarchaeota archaeon]RLI59341.1 MAG: 2-oxoacid:acceptor oxidoreductase subunit alpha [Candidatus Thorarchaeota archaeon]